MHRTRVLVIAGWYPTTRNPVTGVFVKEHAKAAALYNDVVVLYNEGIDPSVRSIYRIDDSMEDGLRTLRLGYRKSPIPKTSYFIYLWSMFAAFRKLIHDGFKPDLIHAHIYSAGVPAVLLGRRYRIPVVITEHSSEFPRRRVRGLERLKAKLAFRCAAVICPVSDALGRSIRSLAVRGIFRTVPNVVDTAVFHPNNSHATLPHHGAIRLLLVALLDSKKGVPDLLNAVTLLNQAGQSILLDIVGDGPDRAEYEALVDQLGLREVVTFHGMRKKREVAEYMRASDLLVLPSPYETFGCVLIESLACGKPVVAVGCGGPAEIVSEEVGKLAKASSPEHLADAIRYVVEHLQDYSPLHLSAFAQERFGLESVAAQLADVYVLAMLSRGKRRVQ